TTPSSPRLQLAPIRPSWQRMSVLTSVLLLGWALLVPAAAQPAWWHMLLAPVLVAAFLGSWHGQHLSRIVGRWALMAWRNHRLRPHPRAAPAGLGRQPTSESAEPARPARVLEATTVIHLRPHPHSLATPAEHDDQLPWKFIVGWLHRYGVRADALTVCSMT